MIFLTFARSIENNSDDTYVPLRKLLAIYLTCFCKKWCRRYVFLVFFFFREVSRIGLDLVKIKSRLKILFLQFRSEDNDTRLLHYLRFQFSCLVLPFTACDMHTPTLVFSRPLKTATIIRFPYHCNPIMNWLPIDQIRNVRLHLPHKTVILPTVGQVTSKILRPLGK